MVRNNAEIKRKRKKSNGNIFIGGWACLEYKVGRKSCCHNFYFL